MSGNDIVLRFENVSYERSHAKPILDEVGFSLRKGMKMTLMGQNGAGKSTMLGLITGLIEPESGKIHIAHGLSVATARQVIPRAELSLSVREFFEKTFSEASFAKASKGRGKIYDIDPRIDAALDVVNLHAPKERLVNSFSGGQQARLLLASALIQDPDLLLLDEPTNNLDKEGIAHLTKFLVEYEKTVIVISHDADFLNAFTKGVLYLDARTQKVEQYVGNYFNVVKQIQDRIEKENMKNAQLAKTAQANKEKANFFAMKGGQLRLVAKRMREKAEEAEESMVDVRKEDKTIKEFSIPCQSDLTGEVLHISSFKRIINHKASVKKKEISLKKNQHLLLKGPNGIGKSTLLESLANTEPPTSHEASKGKEGATITKGVKVGYYRQDFSNLDFSATVHDVLWKAMDRPFEESLRATAAGFLIGDDIIKSTVGHLSEGQKGLVAFARLVLMKPGLLILDEPTNHINFRHIPVIAKALDEYKGAMVLVSHVPEFVSQIRIDEVLDLEK